MCVQRRFGYDSEGNETMESSRYDNRKSLSLSYSAMKLRDNRAAFTGPSVSSIGFTMRKLSICYPRKGPLPIDRPGQEGA